MYVFAIPLFVFLSDPFNPRVNDVYCWDYNSIPHLLSVADRKKTTQHAIEARIVVFEVTDTVVHYYEGSKRESKRIKEFAAYVATQHLIPQYYLPLFNLFKTGKITVNPVE